jgi:hypothetical protein
MSKPRQKKQPKGDYQTGYARPPVAHQFKKGQPRPPRKPKPEKSAPTLYDYFDEELQAPMRIVEDGVEQCVPKGKAVAKAAIKGAIKECDPRRLKGFLPPPKGQEAFDFSDIDLEIVARFLAQAQRQRQQQAPPPAEDDDDDDEDGASEDMAK